MCTNCGVINNYYFKEAVRQYEINDCSFEMTVELPVCKNCGSLVYIREVEEKLANKANDIVRKKKGIITRKEIIDLLDGYSLSKGLLSKMLGWDESILIKYIDFNYTPSDKNSRRLKELKDPRVFQQFLENDDVKKILEEEPGLMEKIQNKIQCKLL